MNQQVEIINHTPIMGTSGILAPTGDGGVCRNTKNTAFTEVSTKKQPFYFVNVHCKRGSTTMFTFEQEITHDRDKAIREAEEQDDAYPYCFTLINLGRIDLRPEFSDEYHDHVAHDSWVDMKIDEAKERRAGMEIHGQ